MAVKYKDLKKKDESTPLLQSEYEMIDNLEKWIDERLNEWDTDTYNQTFSIELCYAEFNYWPITNAPISLKPSSRLKMKKELNRRYKEAGWIVSVEYDDMLDGPNFAGTDYWTLKPS